MSIHRSFGALTIFCTMTAASVATGCATDTDAGLEDEAAATEDAIAASTGDERLAVLPSDAIPNGDGSVTIDLLTVLARSNRSIKNRFTHVTWVDEGHASAEPALDLRANEFLVVNFAPTNVPERKQATFSVEAIAAGRGEVRLDGTGAIVDGNRGVVFGSTEYRPAKPAARTPEGIFGKADGYFCGSRIQGSDTYSFPQRDKSMHAAFTSRESFAAGPMAKGGPTRLVSLRMTLDMKNASMPSGGLGSVSAYVARGTDIAKQTTCRSGAR